MKIKFMGFEWKLGKGISIDNFCTQLGKASGKEMDNRILAICKKDGFWVGVLLTIKNIKAYCQLKNDGKEFIITPKELDENSNMVDFNFFAIKPESGRGLYQYYHNSAGTNTFCAFCRKRYNEYRNLLIEKERLEAGGDAILKSELAKIKSKYSGVFYYSTLLKPNGFEDYVNTLKKIKFFSYEFSTIDSEEQNMTPLGKLAERKVYKLFFSRDPSITDRIKEAIINLSPSKKCKRAIIEGLDENDNDAVYKLLNDYNSYAEFDYNGLVKTVNINSSDLISSINESIIIKDLLRLAAEDRQVKAMFSEEN